VSHWFLHSLFKAVFRQNLFTTFRPLDPTKGRLKRSRGGVPPPIFHFFLRLNLCRSPHLSLRKVSLSLSFLFPSGPPRYPPRFSLRCWLFFCPFSFRFLNFFPTFRPLIFLLLFFFKDVLTAPTAIRFISLFFHPQGWQIGPLIFNSLCVSQPPTLRFFIPRPQPPPFSSFIIDLPFLPGFLLFFTPFFFCLLISAFALFSVVFRPHPRLLIFFFFKDLFNVEFWSLGIGYSFLAPFQLFVFV